MLNELVEKFYDKLNENDLYIWRYISGNKLECYSMTIQQLSKVCNISPSRIIQFAKKLGLQGYSELKVYLKLEIEKTSEFDPLIIQKSTAELINTLKDFQTKDLEEIMELIYLAKRIYVVGIGYIQAIVARQLQCSFSYINKMVHLINGNKELDLILRNISSADICIIISLSGNNKESIDIVRKMKYLEVKTLGIALDNNNLLEKTCDYFLGFRATPHKNIFSNISYTDPAHFFIIISMLVIYYMEYYHYNNDLKI
ncbi:hypothetical protein AN639_07245 [Candidatus Epulonipiscium fishelsonii]|uniref:Uncharacterized protein n=1 Tax=Candidatus Epulonipiscium fishelsonii TaxID=77094 RepID=A0ACC8X9R6_9FIRM|nr:hypothetical protein AN639_07245 [Epulopiscium sp. SCG-B05WGA-EpuloA1]ONI39044.1 hypothetical protein AN396_09225 [Epulopiscium sp. SCG-B11WGA-EpuloA1]